MSVLPYVSIVIPTYNRAELLRRSIVSVLAQTFRAFELIVVDDASTDHTGEIIDSFADDRIHYVRQETNQGATAARNVGIRESRGRYIAFQDSDDEWLPEKLARQVQLLDASPPEVGIVYCCFLRWDGRQASCFPPRNLPFREGNLSRHLLRRSSIGTPTLLIRKDCFEELSEGFDERLPRFQEWDLLIRLAAITQFRIIDEPLVLAHETPGNLTSNKQASIRAREIILEKHYATLERFPVILAGHYCDIGHMHCLYNSCWTGRVWFRKALRLSLCNLKAWSGWMASLAGMRVYKIVLQVLGRNVVE